MNRLAGSDRWGSGRGISRVGFLTTSAVRGTMVGKCYVAEGGRT